MPQKKASDSHLSLACYNGELTRLRGHLLITLGNTYTEYSFTILQTIIGLNGCRITNTLPRHDTLHHDVLGDDDMSVTRYFCHSWLYAINRYGRVIKDLKHHPGLLATAQHTVSTRINKMRVSDFSSPPPLES